MSDKTSSNQQTQEKLLEAAMKQPGVAVAAETYGRIAPYSPLPPIALTSSGYAVGGNA